MDQFIGEIRPFPFDWAPEGWLLCQGQTESIQQFPALFAVIGTIYGGDGKSTFKLPNLQGVSLVGTGTPVGGVTPILLGKITGSETVTITPLTSPSHTHTFMGKAGGGTARTSVPDATSFIGNYSFTPSTGAAVNPGGYVTGVAPDTQLNPKTISAFNGLSGAHENRSPYLVINYCIAAAGDYPIEQ